MLTCYIIDDESRAINVLVSHISKTPSLQLLGSSTKPLEALSEFAAKNNYPDITFLDIEMPQINGIEASTLLKDKTAVVFTTAHPDFAIEAFEKDISDYLLKPISFERFAKCVQKLQRRFEEKKSGPAESFYIQTGNKGKMVKVHFADILFIESQGNYVAITTKEEKHLTYFSLTDLQERLPSSFLRINKSFIANTDKINRVEGYEVFFENGTSYLVGTSYKASFTEYMNRQLFKSKRS